MVGIDPKDGLDSLFPGRKARTDYLQFLDKRWAEGSKESAYFAHAEVKKMPDPEIFRTFQPALKDMEAFRCCPLWILWALTRIFEELKDKIQWCS